MDLRQLRYFVAVAEELHFGRAALRLSIAQSPLSQQIRRLEADLGTTLFERTNRRVELTTAGTALLPEARAALRAAQRAREIAQRVGAGEEGAVTIGYVATAAFRFLPPMLRAYRERAPRVVTALERLPGERQIEAVLTGALTLGLVRQPPERDGVASRAVDRERFMVALAADHPLAKRKRIRLPDLADEPWLTFARERGPGMYDQILALGSEAGFAPRIASVAGGQPTIVSLVASGFGVALVPSSVASLRTADVAYRPIEGGSPAIDLFAVWSETAHPAVPALLESAGAAAAWLGSRA